MTMTPEQAHATLSGITIGALRALIEAKAHDQSMGAVNPFASLESVAPAYLSRLAGRQDDEALVLEARRTDDPARLAGLDAATRTVIARNTPRMMHTADYILALSILRDFG